MSNSSTKRNMGVEAVSRASLRFVAGVGGVAREHLRELQYVAAVIGTVLYTSIAPRHWTRIARNNLARQILTIGIESLPFICVMAVFVGISVVVQLSFWTGEAGQSRLLGPLLVAVVARELGPILTNFVLIVRSSSAMTTELAILKTSGEVRALEAQGRDPFLHLVMPRVTGAVVSTFCMTTVFIFVAFASGYLFAAWLGKGSRDLLLFADTVSSAVQPKDVFNILAKTTLPALFASASCCIGGLGVRGSAAEIPHATQRTLARSVAGLLVISAVVSLLTYL